MKRIALLLAAAALGVTMLVSAAPAQATSCVTKYHPSDPSWITVCGREFIAVCDAQADGHNTWARFLYQGTDPQNWSSTKPDSYGRSSTGDFCYHERTVGWLALVRVCVSYEGCGKWRDAGGPSRLLRPMIGFGI
jgi:hypothetical protein